MIQRVRIVPTEPMARFLAGHHPRDRATPEAAALLLLHRGYHPDDIAVGLDEARHLAGDFAALAAAENPVMQMLTALRDMAAAASILLSVALWALPA